MNYAFKMMAVVLALGVMVLQGCQTIPYSKLSDLDICWRIKQDWSNRQGEFKYENEAKSRGLDCGVKKENNKVIALNQNKTSNKRPYGHYLNKDVCYFATYKDKNSLKRWNKENYLWVDEAIRRGLSCGLGESTKTFVEKEKQNNTALKQNQIKNKYCTPKLATNLKTPNKFRWNNCEGILKISTGSFKGYEYIGEFKNGLPEGTGKEIAPTGDKYNGQFKKGLRHGYGKYFFKNGEKYIGEFQLGKINGYGTSYYKNGNKYVGEHKNSKANGKGILYVQNGKNLEGVWKNDTLLSKKEKNYRFKNKSKPLVSSSELILERKKRIELERKLAALEAKQKLEKQRIDTDTRVPLLEVISNKTKGKRGTITGIARDNVEVAEVTIDGKSVSLSVNGNFKFSTFVPADGIILNVQVTDVAGLTSSKTVSLQRNNNIASTSISFDRLNPLGKRVKVNPNALALIVGVEGYKNTKADALYAASDAKMFRDYASEKLGISEGRIKTLLNDNATEQEILLSVKEWLRRSAKPNKSDIYIFFAGHGLASQDGKNMYLLPYDGSPRLLEKTAILRDELFSDIKQANPLSVTVFLDTCYSGVTRNEEMLIAGRPIVIKAKEQAIPDGFTLFSAASNEQISRPLEEAKHGMFSYFLMKGMEGDANTNNDNKITVRELHAYIEQNVVQQSSGSQTPELQGDKDRVLVQFN